VAAEWARLSVGEYRLRGIDVRQQGNSVIVAVQVRPKSRPGIDLTDVGLVIRVGAAPEKGRATDEARRALANALDVPPSAVSLRTGRTGRRKTFTVGVASVTEVRARLLAAVRERM
jgi:uncharacterized protein YggU (UPF0235/DUF167 family)